ncbi:MAG: D-alanine--D-alanine ligase [Alphaproteobacteria bacterium]|nr:D-alanine--D-alanine ligase [Alphaproteobacteria bacterium]
MKKVLVVKGGFSSEREVSLVSGENIATALREKGYDVIEHDLTDTHAFLDVLRDIKPDVVFNALHGNFGEDGEIQGLLDMLQIPYTHSDLKASVLGMNKELAKQIALRNGVQTAPFEVMTYRQFQANGTQLDMPYVVKPASDGSSVGVFIVRQKEDLEQVNYPDENTNLVVEKYISGRELTVAIVKDKACAVTELRPKKAFYNYKAKYTPGATEHILPANLPSDIYQKALDNALKMHQFLGCHIVSRSDFRYNEDDGLVFLEINTNPGMTPLSLVPEQAKYVGISYEDLCATLVENAVCRKIG